MGSKQNYSLAKDLRVESLQKASSLHERTKIELRERKEGAGPHVRAPLGLPTKIPSSLRGSLLPQRRTRVQGGGGGRPRKPEKADLPKPAAPEGRISKCLMQVAAHLTYLTVFFFFLWLLLLLIHFSLNLLG